MFLDNKYYNWYEELTSKPDRVLDCYIERHHIIPRSMGGNDDSDNLVVLTAREHFIAHLLLSKCVTKKYKKSMSFALWNMVNRDSGIRTTARMYSLLRENHAKFLSKELSGSNNPMFGKEHSEEVKQKISDGGKGLKRSAETRRKISEANKGEKNSMYGRTITEEQKEASRKRLKDNNPMHNEEVVNKIKKAKENTYNCFDVQEQLFVRIPLEVYRANKHRYKGNRSKEAKLLKGVA